MEIGFILYVLQWRNLLANLFMKVRPGWWKILHASVNVDYEEIIKQNTGSFEQRTNFDTIEKGPSSCKHL